MIKKELWRKREIIEISSIHIYQIGLLYYITFGNQYIDKNGEVKNKSKNFEIVTRQLIKWMKEKYISKRGSNCYDGVKGYQKYMDKK